MYANTCFSFILYLTWNFVVSIYNSLDAFVEKMLRKKKNILSCVVIEMFPVHKKAYYKFAGCRKWVMGNLYLDTMVQDVYPWDHEIDLLRVKEE